MNERNNDWMKYLMPKTINKLKSKLNILLDNQNKNIWAGHNKFTTNNWGSLGSYALCACQSAQTPPKLPKQTNEHTKLTKTPKQLSRAAHL